MPDWMPGNDYFTDFQHGDPYSKIKKGEIRLPGEAYQRMYNIRDAEGNEVNGDQYSPIDKFRILADVAPYSREFRDQQSQFKFMDLSDEEKKEIQTIKKQVSVRKDRLRLYPYRFTTSNLENETVTVDQIIDQNTFTTLEHPDNPIRFAGMHIPTGKDDPIALEAMTVIQRTIKPGKRVEIAYNEDELNQVKSDTYKTIQSVVYDYRGRNLNLRLLNHDLAKEKENDYSPAAVHARFSPTEIAFGSMWERFAHFDTILHTKFLQVRSPVEDYENREVYGKDWQEWTDPIEDYLIPGIQNGMVQHPLYAIAAGGFFGAAFGSLKAGDVGYDGTRVMARYGKIIGGVIGASVMGAAVLYKNLYEHFKDEAWVPERRKKERDTEEYFDILKYIKYNNLYQKYAREAMDQEHFDVDKYISDKKENGDLRKKQLADLNRVKRQLYVSHQSDWPDIQKILNEMGIDAPSREVAVKNLNAKINELTLHRELEPISPTAAKAILFKQATKKTMYGYESGDPMADVLAAIPKKDRDYLMPFIESPEEERPRILDIAPKYMRRILQSSWGMQPDAQENLQEYFEKHPLPGKKWKGWREDVSLDDVKVKFVDRVGLDPSEFDIWPLDKQRAEKLDVQTPNIFKGKESADTYARKIRELLGKSGLDGVNVEVVESKKKGVEVQMDVDHDRRDDFKQLVNTQGQYIL
jgi:endonuclease YncB( thermonuclease family)